MKDIKLDPLPFQAVERTLANALQAMPPTDALVVVAAIASIYARACHSNLVPLRDALANVRIQYEHFYNAPAIQKDQN